jgi:hypothetical protein
MKKILLFPFLSAMILTHCLGQNSRLITGSGKLVPISTPALQPFTELEFEGIPGAQNSIIEIETGRTENTLSISADNNLVDLIKVQQKGQKLIIGLPDNRNNKMWIEDTNIKIRINMNTLNALSIASNGICRVNGLQGDDLSVQKSQNGDLYLTGTLQQVTIKKTGNGNVFAERLSVKDAQVTSMGNGDVRVNASQNLDAERSGNGSIINSGGGNIKRSLDMGNGVTTTSAENQEIESKPAPASVQITLKNTAAKSRDFTVRGMWKKGFSYGIEIGPLGQRTENFPVGTKIIDKQGDTLYEVKPEDAGKTIRI